MNKLGCHMSFNRLLKDAETIKAEAAQVFLGNPQSWAQPVMKDEKIAAWKKITAKVQVFAHSPYMINPAGTNPEFWEKTITSLQANVNNAAACGVSGVVVHAGSAGGKGAEEASLNWGKALERLDLPVPVLIENMAGGKSTPGRTLEQWGRLWDSVGKYNVGVCLDTCHAHAGGLGTEDIGAKMLALTGRVDLIHLNGSLDEADSGRDHHSNLVNSVIPMEHLVELLKVTGAPGVLEVPGGLPAVATDLKALRAALRAS